MAILWQKEARGTYRSLPHFGDEVKIEVFVTPQMMSEAQRLKGYAFKARISIPNVKQLILTVIADKSDVEEFHGFVLRQAFIQDAKTKAYLDSDIIVSEVRGRIFSELHDEIVLKDGTIVDEDMYKACLEIAETYAPLSKKRRDKRRTLKEAAREASRKRKEKTTEEKTEEVIVQMESDLTASIE